MVLHLFAFLAVVLHLQRPAYFHNSLLFSLLTSLISTILWIIANKRFLEFDSGLLDFYRLWFLTHASHIAKAGLLGVVSCDPLVVWLLVGSDFGDSLVGSKVQQVNIIVLFSWWFARLSWVNLSNNARWLLLDGEMRHLDLWMISSFPFFGVLARVVTLEVRHALVSFWSWGGATFVASRSWLWFLSELLLLKDGGPLCKLRSLPTVVLQARELAFLESLKSGWFSLGLDVVGIACILYVAHVYSLEHLEVAWVDVVTIWEGGLLAAAVAPAAARAVRPLVTTAALTLFPVHIDDSLLNFISQLKVASQFFAAHIQILNFKIFGL